MRRRSCRSAVSPATRVRANSGRNWASPIIPTANAASATDMVCRASLVHLPRDDDRLGAGGQGAEEPAGQEEHVRATGKQRTVSSDEVGARSV